jgi:two-component system, NtrC family, response regulator AtoC
LQPTRKEPTILVAEDDAEIRSYFQMALRGQGYLVETADDGEVALEVLKQNPWISAVLLDIVMPRRDGLDALKEIRRIDPSLPVIMISGASSPINVVEAMKSGAKDFLAKPVSHSDLRKALRTVLEPKHPAAGTDSIPQPTSTNIFFGQNKRMAELRMLLPQIGWSEAPALILGETGVGKEMIARELHAQSPRSKKPFLKINCAALPSELVESELFGYERGAFTGAIQKKPGMFEIADGGTIFLDEIGDMDFKLQAKLLQVLQDSEFTRLGGRETIRVDVRVIAATHKDLDKAIAQNTFRRDLYFRLNVINLSIPSLRECKEDLIGLMEFLIQKHTKNGSFVPTITAALRDVFLAYDWPGNIRELENVVRKMIVLRDPEMIIRELRGRMATQRALEPMQEIGGDGAAGSARKTILEQVSRAKNEAETTAILAALDSTYWNRKKAATLLKIDYKALLYKMKKLGIDDKMATLSDMDAKAAKAAGAAV